MTNYTEIIEKFLDEEELHYTTHTYDWGSSTRVGFREKAGERIDVHLVDRKVNRDGDPEVHILSFDVLDLIHIPDNKMAAAIIFTNQMNKNPFFRFRIDRDNDVNMTFDLPLGLTEESLYSVLKEMFPMFVMEAHENYKRYSKMLWAPSTTKDDAPIDALA